VHANANANVISIGSEGATENDDDRDRDRDHDLAPVQQIVIAIVIGPDHYRRRRYRLHQRRSWLFFFI
jgi:hypothetical protein